MKGFLYWSAYNNICETLHMDAAPGRLMNGDAVACGSSLAKASRDADATPELFVAAVRQFLSTCDARTCRPTCHDPAYAEYDLGFSVQRSGDHLYVTEARQEERLAPGMRIAAVGRNTVPFLLKDIAQEIFWGRGTDREDWGLALRMFDDVDVFPGDGHVMRMDLRRYPVQTRAPRLACARREGACVLTVESLADGAAVARLLEEAGEALDGAERLVIDLRACAGEADPASYLALLPYLCDRDIPAREVFPDRQVYTIYSKANAELLLAGIERARKGFEGRAGDGGDAETQAGSEVLDALADDIRAKADEVLQAKRRTTGLQERRRASELPEIVPSPFDEEEVHVRRLGAHGGGSATEQTAAQMAQAGQAGQAAARATGATILLVGPQTGVGAERLAEAVMGMDRVRLVGRATPGAVDYENYVTRDYPDILARFTYPISRTVANREGRGYARTGLPLDVHVLWTPDECAGGCGRDLVLEAALGM